MDQRFEWQQRSLALLGGEEGLRRLELARVAVLGLGGVGAAAAEGLARLGVGRLLLCDPDVYSLSNLNRQLFATVETLGRSKVEAAADRLRAINPALELALFPAGYQPGAGDFLYEWAPQVVLDAVDLLVVKLELAEECHRRGIPLFSSMGTGGRLDPTLLRSGDIAETAGAPCALARTVRAGLRKRGVPKLACVYSLEVPNRTVIAENGRHIPCSGAPVPNCAGMTLASLAVRSLLAKLPAKEEGSNDAC